MRNKPFRTTLILGLYLAITVPILIISLSGMGCGIKNGNPDVILTSVPGPKQASSTLSFGGKLDLNNFAPPNTNIDEQPYFDFFVWNTFIALNWPAIIPDSTNGYLRGFPDTTRSFVSAAPDALTVWETYKEKREVFNHDGMDPGPWSAAVDYGPLRHGENAGTPNVDEGTRIIHQGSKTVFDTFDETVEVLSEALERTLDSIPPIGGPVTNPVHGKPVAPRVWRGPPSENNPVVYEVKVNFDFYDYVRKNKLYQKNDTLPNPVNDIAQTGNIRLPYRTSAAYGTKGQEPESDHQIVLGYNNGLVKNFFKDSVTNGVTPPLIGAVHLKAAWIAISDEEARSGKYHTADATYFVSKKIDGVDSLIAVDSTFGLIGLHIIQRIHSVDKHGHPLPKGGTFVFATWEHIENDNAGFTYSNYYDPGADSTGNPAKGFYPDVYSGAPSYPVKRRYQPISQEAKDGPIGTKQVNKMVHDAIKAVDPNSVWLNYRLIGTQFEAINVTDIPVNPRYPVSDYDPTGIGQPAFLANLVIETNDGLQHFEGLPPGITPIRNYQGIYLAPSVSLSQFDHNAKNTAFGRNAYNMGGCMGCHGVAQNQGYSFSFVLLGGYAGAKTDSQTQFDEPISNDQDTDD